MSSASSDKSAVPDQLLREAERHEERGDLKRAFRCLLAGAQLGDSGCQLNLGNFYASGKGVRRNLKRAANWYKEAYKNGSSSGALNLAIDRRNEGNIRSAVIWFKKAIALKDGEACVELAKIYNAQKGGQNAAEKLLRRALRFNKDFISVAGREEAESLLRELGEKKPR